MTLDVTSPEAYNFPVGIYVHTVYFCEVVLPVIQHAVLKTRVNPSQRSADKPHNT